MKIMKAADTGAAALFVLLALLCTACADSNAPAEVESAADTTAPVTEEAKDPYYETDLAIRDLGGVEFVIASNNNPNIHHTIVPEEETAETLNDALYERNRTIEETYNVDLVEYLYDFTNPSEVKNTVTAGDDAYDLIMLTCPDALTWWQESLLIPFDDVPNINLAKGYWDQSINESLSLGGVHYIAEGAFNLDIYDLTFCLLFNKTLIEQFDLASPYKTVNQGTWTYETMLAQMQTVATDINGDGQYGADDFLTDLFTMNFYSLCSR